MFLFTRLALVTCAFYIGMNLLLDAALFGLAAWTGMAGIHFHRGGRWILFGLIWLASFSLAWRLLMTAVFARTAK